ncbi:Heterogeneous nuclear ribonucleoprotein 1, partial [Cucurbita argyrosperma subsp. sororia]
MASKSKGENPHTGDGASPGKIFIGGLAKDTTYTQFNKHFGTYGEITDSVIMKDRYTGQPRGFGFITYADPSVVDKVIEDTHVINGKQVEIKRTIPKGHGQSKDFKTKKIFVGGIPSTVTEDEFNHFFSKYGKVAEHQIIRDHETNRSRGFGFIVFEEEEVVDEILSNGNMIDMSGTQVEIKKAEPKKSSNPPPASAYGFGPGPFRTPGGLGARIGSGYGYGSSGDFGGGYGGFGGNSLGGYRGESSLGYSSRFGPYSGGFGGGYGTSGLGGYGRGVDGYGSYGSSSYGGGYDSGPGASYGGASGLYGRGGYSGGSRYHPYAR